MEAVHHRHDAVADDVAGAGAAGGVDDAALAGVAVCALAT